MDDFPRYNFPSLQANEEANNVSAVFENYGTWKSIITEKRGEEEIVLPRHVCALNSRNLRSQNSSSDYIILQERCKISICNPFSFLCKPYPILKIFPELKLIDLYSKQQQKRSRGVTYVSNHLKKQNTLATFHPDITHDTFLKHCAEYYGNKSNVTEANEMDSLFICMPMHTDSTVETSVSNFHKKGKRKVYINSSMMDVDCNVLEPILAEDYQLNAKKCIGDRQYAGSNLVFQKLDQDDNNTNSVLGVLISQFDYAGDELVIRLVVIYIDNDNKHNIKVGSELTMSFPNGIYQIDVRSFSSTTIIAVRSSHRITILKLDKNAIEWDLDEHVAKFEDKCIEVLGAVSCQEAIVHFCLSPYLHNECLFVTEYGKIFVCDYQNNELEKSKDLNLPDPGWAMCLYADNPRIIYIADLNTVSMYNIRNEKNTELFDVKKSKHKNDVIWSMKKGIRRNEIFISTNFMLYLIDNRIQNTPLLEWSVNTRFPCQYICCTQLQVEQNDSVIHSTNAVVIGSQVSNEIQCYQYCDNIIDDKLPPHSIGGPISLTSFPRVYDTLNPKTLLENKYIKARLESPLRGLDIFNLNIANCAVIFMLNAASDLGFEMINLHDRELAFSDLFSSDVDTTCKDEVKKNHEKWYKRAIAGMEKKCKPFASPAVVGKLGPNFFDTISQQFNKPNMKKHDHCAWCNPDNDYDGINIDDMNQICGICGFDVYTSQHLSKNTKPGCSTGSKIWVDPKPKAQRPPLHLIDLDPDTGSECARLLKGTWSNSYETYWKHQAFREEEEKEKARQESLDILSQ